jgi:hypothetical protein
LNLVAEADLMNKDTELQAHREAFAHGCDAEDMARRWHAKPIDSCEHDWTPATVELEFQSGLKQEVAGFRCTKCRLKKIVYR